MSSSSLSSAVPTFLGNGFDLKLPDEMARDRPLVVERPPEKMIERIYNARLTLLGPDDPDTLISKNDLAQSMQLREDWAGAEELQREVLEDRRRILGPEDQDTLTTLNDLAQTRLGRGELELAEEMHRTCLEARNRTLGPEHPDTMASECNLARTLTLAGKGLEEAEALHREALAGRMWFLGPGHPDSIASKNALASTLDAMGKLDESEQLQKDVLVAALVETDIVPEDMRKDTDIVSHLKVQLDEDGQPSVLQFVYVDEVDCIGCKLCAQVARNTFFIEPDAGRARAFSQGADDGEVVAEAIDCCPVNCINYVDLDDLIILETERSRARTINPAMAGMRGISERTGEQVSRAKQGKKGAIRCGNCPGNGCRECPMYGIGYNPEYLARQRRRDAVAQASGRGVEQRLKEEIGSQLDQLNSDPAYSNAAQTETLYDIDDEVGASLRAITSAPDYSIGTGTYDRSAEPSRGTGTGGYTAGTGTYDRSAEPSQGTGTGTYDRSAEPSLDAADAAPAPWNATQSSVTRDDDDLDALLSQLWD